MGEENNVVNNEATVADVIAEETRVVETEEQNSSCGFKQVAGIAAVTTVVIGAGYGLYRLGKVVAGKAKDTYRDYKAKKFIKDLEDDDEDAIIEETPVEEQKSEFPDHKKKK